MARKKRPEVTLPEPGPDDEVDAHGTLWTPTGYTLGTGEGETFGPGHPAVPAKVKELQERKKAKEK